MSYFILSYYYHIEAYSFSNRRQKGGGFRRKSVDRGAGRDTWRGIRDQDVVREGEMIFNKRKICGKTHSMSSLKGR